MKYKNYIKLVALLPLLALLGCEANETPGAESQETVPVTIRLGLEKDGLSTRADDDDAHHADELDEEGNEEVINSLAIYILHNGSLLHTLTWDDYENSTDKVRTVNLPIGDNQVYAIANLPTESDELELEAIQDNPSVDAISEITDEHPFIPMSADTTWNVQTTQTTYTVNLIRMVAKMRVTIIDERESAIQTRANEGETDHSLTIESLLPHETNLFREAHGVVELPDGINFANWKWSAIKYAMHEDELHAHSGHFYLHESKPGEEDVFNLTLHDGEKDRTGSFSAQIYRNHLFPLVIHLTDYHLDFTGSSYQHGPIGVVKDPIAIDGYTIDLPSGASAVNIKIGLKEAGEDEVMKNITWTCDISQTGSLPSLKDIETSTDDGVLTVLDNYNFPSGLTGTITLNLSTTVNEEGKDKVLNYTVTINVRTIQDGDATRSASQAPQPLIIEL